MKKLLNFTKNAFKGLFVELKEISWISYADLKNLSIIVILFLLFGAILILVLDQTFAIIRNFVIFR